jgi:hypothetical protein|tara:strand:+ start:117 stop:386 length:270 start_codon:yes stop_codon:yes gene_type:complete
MIKEIQIVLWGWISELEYRLYPWKTSTPPSWAVERYNIDADIISDDHVFDNDSLHYDWLKSHDDKINRLQTEMIWATDEIHKLKKHAGI